MNRWPRLLRRALERCGLKREPFYLSENPDYAGIEVGAYSYGRPLLLGHDNTPETHVRIGRYCSLAHGVRILLRANHPLAGASTYPLEQIVLGEEATDFARSRGPVHIGHDVWIGYEALILGGVTIGNGAVIGARAVVTRDVPPYGIVAGNPARLLRHRFDDATIARLEQIRWWDWPADRVRKHAALLSQGPIDEFLRVAAPFSSSDDRASPGRG
jgi:virginiamycin A acetyltransferase